MHPNDLKKEMYVSHPKEVLDLYDWLPSYGETKMSLKFEELTLSVDIFYDSDLSTELEKKTIYFTGVCDFLVSSTPGVDITCFKYEPWNSLGCIVEFTNSEAAELWKKHFKPNERQIKHFHFYLLSVNQQIEVFAENCFIS